MTLQPLNVAVPWSLSHYIPLDGFHPLYRALFDHVPDNVTLSAWDNVKLHQKVQSDTVLRGALVKKAEAERRRLACFATDSIAKKYQEYPWPPNQVLTRELMGDVEFHHTAPFPTLERPFVFHCESFAPVLFPFAQQGSGNVEDHKELRKHYRGILAHPLCLGIFSHVPDTLHAISQFLSDPTIDSKLFPSRIGLSAKTLLDDELQDKPSLCKPRFLFINSANQNSLNFFRRGGHLVLRFWKEFVTSGREGLLILRCAKPSDRELVEYGVDLSLLKAELGRSIIWAQDYLASPEMNALMANAHFFLLPSASLHSVSIMHAMALGTVPVVSDTVGTSVYITDDENGIVLHGVRKHICHHDEVTGILVDRYHRTPDLDEFLVAQLTSRICALLEEPSAYWDMRTRTLSHAREQFSGQAFSGEFWAAVSELYVRSKYKMAPFKGGARSSQFTKSLRTCTIQDDGWARVFEGPTQPILRINTGRGVVWQLGSSMVHANGNPRMELNDWSVLAQHYDPKVPHITFANTLVELEGKYLRSVEGRCEGARRELVEWVSKTLKPFPALYRYGAKVLCMVRRYRGFRFTKNKAEPDIELVRQDVSGYNIIRHIDRYYAIRQSEGEFIPDKAVAGGYSSCFSDYSVDQVLQRIAGSGPQSVQAGLADDDLGQIEMVCEGFHGFKVMRRGVDFHAILQCEGPFVPEKLQSKQYSRSFSGYSLEEVQRAIVEALDSEPGLTDSYPQSADRVSKS